jgi:hypothetical protein
MSYLIVKCPHCGDVRAVHSSVKSFQCFTCGRRVKLAPHLILYRTGDRDSLPLLVMKFKEISLKNSG